MHARNELAAGGGALDRCVGVLHVPNMGATSQIFMCLPRFLRRTHATAAAYVVARSRPLAVRAIHASVALRAIDMAKVDSTARLAELRKLMKQRNVDVYSMEIMSRSA